MSADTNVAVIGAGPYGLSLAAHLRGLGVDHRIVGSPMQFWLERMPKGMLLKSDGFASNLSDPGGRFSLRQFCQENRIEYADVGIPVALETFNAYGVAFQKRYAPEVKNATVQAITQSRSGFLVQLADGEQFSAKRVVLAIGLFNFRHVPPELANLPSGLLSHSSEHGDLERFRGSEVVVLGAGSSAMDLAVLLHESGAHVKLVARRNSLSIAGKMQLPRPLWQRIRRPMSPVGPGWRARLLTEAPLLFRILPEAMRLDIVKRFLGPAAGWFVKDRIKRIPTLLGHHLQGAELSNGQVRLRLVDGNGSERQVSGMHVIAATGYKVDLRRLPFLSEDIQLGLRSVQHTPVLSSDFQSSVPGLYFMGITSANSFGPVMRFAAGCEFTASRISRFLARD